MVLPFRLYAITNPLIDAPNFRQTQTATVARNFYRNGINLFQTELDIFGIGNEKYLTLEFPLYEAIVTIFYKTFFFSEIWGRIVSVAAGFISGYYLYRLTKLVFRNNKLAIFSYLFFLFIPLNLYYQRAFLMESTVIAFLLSGIYYFCLWCETKKWQHYFLSMITLSLGFVQKGVYGPFWLLPMVVFYLKRYSFRKIFSTRLLLLFLIPLLSLFLWQWHVNLVNTANRQEYFTTTNISHLLWNFGTLEDRLSIKMWSDRLDLLLKGIFLKPGLLFFVLGIFAIFKYSNSNFLYSWLFSAIIYFVTLFRIQSHNYYQMVMTPPIAILIAAGLLSIVQIVNKVLIRINNSFDNTYITAFLLMIVFMTFAGRAWQNSRSSYDIDISWYRRMKEVGNSLPKNSYGILVNYGFDWNSVYTYHTDKKMLSVDAVKLTKEDITKWQSQGYSFIVIHDFHKYQNLFQEKEFSQAIDYINQYPQVYKTDDFIVYLFKQ